MGPVLKIKKLSAHALMPRYMTEGSSGMDLSAAIPDPVVVAPGERILLPTGLALEIPPGFDGQVRPRSGLAIQRGLTVINSPGTIDADYRGEVCVGLVNLGKEAVQITPGMRIAQLVICPVARVEIHEAAALSETDRGAGGFGHTGSTSE